ncbi:MAG: hypothetical protein OEY14_17115 [Myxococcales bacterium]|nr:hypothetical protein [Myxococcales bacterium]
MRLARKRSAPRSGLCRRRPGDALPEYMADSLGSRIAAASKSAADIFDSSAITILHEATTDRLRDIDRVTTDCLRIAARRTRSRIDAALVQSPTQHRS